MARVGKPVEARSTGWHNDLVAHPSRFVHRSALIGLVILSTDPANCQEWTTYKPSLRSQVTHLERSKAESLLTAFCVSIADTKQLGLTCEARPLGPAFADITDRQFHPQDIISGHFLDSTSEDAALSGWSAETHPYHWGGTLLLTRRGGKWQPLWYKSGVITRSCEKAERPDGREILICEWEDGGMGHRIHALYAINLKRPSENPPWIASADSFDSDFCTLQQQTMEAVRWGSDRQSFSVVVRTPRWQLLPEGVCGPRPPKRPILSTQFEFEVTNDGLRRR